MKHLDNNLDNNSLIISLKAYKIKDISLKGYNKLTNLDNLDLLDKRLTISLSLNLIANNNNNLNNLSLRLDLLDNIVIGYLNSFIANNYSLLDNYNYIAKAKAKANIIGYSFSLDILDSYYKDLD